MQGSVFQEGIPMPDPPSKGFLRGAYQVSPRMGFESI